MTDKNAAPTIADVIKIAKEVIAAPSPAFLVDSSQRVNEHAENGVAVACKMKSFETIWELEKDLADKTIFLYSYDGHESQDGILVLRYVEFDGIDFNK